MTSPSSLAELTLSQAASLVGTRKVSPVELTEALIARTDAIEPQLDAYITRTSETARAVAKAAETEIMHGGYRGAMHGVPFAVKDIYDTAGVLTTGHSRTCIDRVPARDATAVARMKGAGGVLLGKLATHEFAHGGPSFDLPWPPARNPWNTAHFTGGSSSGSGAALAARLVPASLGSDTGGSIRGPAGLCGIAGLKPTYGLVSRAGVMPNSYTYDHCGPMARTAEDCALLMNVVAGHDPADPSSSGARRAIDYTSGIGEGIKGLRIGVVRHFWERDSAANPELAAAMETSLAVLRDLGAVLEDVELRPLQYYQDVKVVMAESELLSLHLRELIARPGDFGQDFRARVLPACLFTAEDYVRASRERRRIVAEMAPIYRRFDLLVTAGTSAAPRLDRHDVLAFWTKPNFTVPFNCTGGPALSLLNGFNAAGLPMSLQIAGRPFDDATVLRAGHAFERAVQLSQRQPNLQPGIAAAAIAPEPWRPDTSAVPARIRDQALAAAAHVGLRLPEPIAAELVASAPVALAMAARLQRDHGADDEVSSIFDLTRDGG
ncbi:MAG: amidase [Hyphomicrobiaceae bacterium]